MNVWPSPSQIGITDYATDDDAIVDALDHLLDDLKFVGRDSRYSAGDDRRGYEARITRVERMLADRGAVS